MNGVFKARGFQTVQYEMPMVVPGKPVEVPTVAPEPVVAKCSEHNCTGVFDHEVGQWTCGGASYHSVAPEPTIAPEPTPEPVPEPTVAPEPTPEPVPEPTVAPEPAPEPVPEPAPAVVELPVASEVEAPLEVAEAAPEAGLVPENPPTE